MIQIPLESRIGRALFALALFLPALVLMGCVLKLAVASTLGSSMKSDSVRRGLGLDPINAKIQHHLGWLESTGSTFDGYMPSAKAISDLGRAVELAPGEPSYWIDLGAACELRADLACASHAFDTAKSLSPAAPRLHWLVANYDLRVGKIQESLAEFRRTLELDTEYARPIFQICVQVLGDPNTVSERVIPAAKRKQLALPYASFLCDAGYADAAFAVWEEIASRREQFLFSDAADYLQRLVLLARFSDVKAVWTELRQRKMLAAENHQLENLVYNGGFESAPLKAGFDWYYSQPPFVVVDPSAGNAYRGARCLRIEFPVKRNEEYEPVYQFVALEPNHQYELSAYVRSENITSDSGPRLRITDSTRVDDLIAISEPTIGTTPWHQVHLKCATGSRNQFVRVSVWRPRSRSYPADISGSFWLDDITLKPIDSSAGEMAKR